MPMYDYECKDCGVQKLNEIRRIQDRDSGPTCTCGKQMSRAWTVGTAGAFQDDIPGGIEIKHGICNPDGSPRRYFSKSEMTKEAKKRGLMNYVTHVPSPGSDKNRGGHTSRWI